MNPIAFVSGAAVVGLFVFGLLMFLVAALISLWEWACRTKATHHRADQETRIRADARRVECQLADEAFRVQRDMIRHATETMRRDRR